MTDSLTIFLASWALINLGWTLLNYHHQKRLRENEHAFSFWYRLMAKHNNYQRK